MGENDAKRHMTQHYYTILRRLVILNHVSLLHHIVILNHVLLLCRILILSHINCKNDVWALVLLDNAKTTYDLASLYDAKTYEIVMRRKSDI